MTPSEQREIAYDTYKMISWDGEKLTVTEAATLYGYYLAEGRAEICEQLRTVIVRAKNLVRKHYPDENQSEE